jgi:undecaprenyl-diphosphatase
MHYRVRQTASFPTKLAAMHTLLLAPAASALSYFQAIVLGFLQGVTELVPISSLGHTVLFPTLFGWNDLVKAQSQSESFWLAFVVMLHVGSALGLLAYYWRDWVQIIGAFFATLGKRRAETSTERLAWLIIVASIPPAILGLVFEHKLRTLTAKPLDAAILLTVNGLLLFGAERYRRRAEVRELSRDGVTMGAGLARGLDHSDSARFAFLLATPIILAAGVYKLPDLLGHLGNGIRGQAVVAAAVAAVTAVFTVRFLVGYFKTKTLTPFAVYCLLFGVAMIIYTQT